jgi:hypothetical protein
VLRFKDSLRGVIIVQIRAFPSDQHECEPDKAAAQSAGRKGPGAAPPVAKRVVETSRLEGWVDELVGPAMAINNVRTPVQIERNRRDIENLRKNSRLPIRTVIFEACHEGPLSWKLSDEQKGEIEADWNMHANRQAMKAVAEMYAHP